MKSVFISILMFAVAIAAIYFGVFDILASPYMTVFAVICVAAALLLALKVLGNPFKKNHTLKAILLALSVVTLCSCFAASDVYAADPAGVDTNAKATSGASKGCKTLPARYAEIQACILCPLFQVILNTDQTIASKSYSALAGSFRNVVILVLALFIAYQTLITVSAFTKQDTPKYIGTLLTQSFKAGIAALLLSNSSYIYYYAINPLMKAGLEFGLALIFRAELLSEFSSLVQSEQANMPTGVIGQDLLASVMAAVRLFSKAAAQLPAIGSSLICISTHEGTSGLINISMFLEGLLVFAFGWAIALVCCFYLLDSVVRFGIFCALLPFLIACWPFKVTSSYTNTGWKIFMNAFFNFVMMGLVISLNTELISQGLSGGQGGLDAIEKAINGDNVNELKELVLQLYAYTGFPRCLNASATLEKVVKERQAQGKQDAAGEEPKTIPAGTDKYELGRRNLAAMMGADIPSRPAAFIQDTDTFLKEHLFADIFARGVLTNEQRELITVSTLTALGNVNAQLQSHMGLAMNVGVTPQQIEGICAVVKTEVGRKQALNGLDILKKVQGK